MKLSLQDVMRHATQLTRAGRLSEATAAIQRALGGTLRDRTEPQPSPRDVADVAAQTTLGERPALVLEHRGRERDDWAAAEADSGVLDAGKTPVEGVAPRQSSVPHSRAPSTSRLPGEGVFLASSHTHASLTRHYKLYVPPAAAERSLPLVVMLHGCTQDPDDFAAGTDMNRLAIEYGLYVLYPAQAQEANPSKCWNWFKHNHQTRGRGEPAVIASMTRSVMNAHNIDTNRVYIAGLSAGGAMAAIVGAAYPDLFAAVGVHSGLAPGAARTLPEAFMAMNGTTAAAAAHAATPMRAGAVPAQGHQPLPLPVIVFHGDEDRTVHPRNGEQVIAAVLSAIDAPLAPSQKTHFGGPSIVQGASDLGRRYTRYVHAVDAGRPAAEHWILHGGGHAWSGGRDAGSFTDPTGPDASREMLRFFLENPRRPLQ